jgi:hypothetical protein
MLIRFDQRAPPKSFQNINKQITMLNRIDELWTAHVAPDMTHWRTFWRAS